MNWGSLKGLIFEDDDKETKVKGKKEEIKATPIPTPSVTPNKPIASGTGALDENIMSSLKKAIESANFEGFDYLEFTKILEQLSSAIPGEEMRYQAAFASAVAMGTNKEKLILTARHYIDTLHAEKANFDILVEEQNQTTVINKEKDISTIDISIKEKSETIQQITKEINELASKRKAIIDEVTQNKIKIGTVQNDFTACHKIFLDKIEEDIRKITQYIQE